MHLNVSSCYGSQIEAKGANHRSVDYRQAMHKKRLKTTRTNDSARIFPDAVRLQTRWNSTKTTAFGSNHCNGSGKSADVLDTTRQPKRCVLSSPRRCTNFLDVTSSTQTRECSARHKRPHVIILKLREPSHNGWKRFGRMAAGCYCKALQHPLPFVLFVMEKCNQRAPTSTRRLYYTVYSILPTLRNGCLARTKSLVLRVPAYVCTSTTRKVNRSTCLGATARNTVEHTANNLTRKATSGLHPPHRHEDETSSQAAHSESHYRITQQVSVIKIEVLAREMDPQEG